MDIIANVLGITQDEVRIQLTGLKNKLKMFRNRTCQIPKDSKLLTSWNSMALTAFASALKIEPAFTSTGHKLAQFLIQQWDEKQLQRANTSKKEGKLEDYATVSSGLVAWGKATNDKKALKTSIAIAQHAWQHFYHDGKWQETRQSTLPKGVQHSHLVDTPTHPQKPYYDVLVISPTHLN